jgi:hypothetical protein
MKAMGREGVNTELVAIWYWLLYRDVMYPVVLLG